MPIIAGMTGDSAIQRYFEANPGVAIAAASVTPKGVESDFRGCDSESRFEIGSISKVITAILLCEAVQDGLCEFDSPLSGHLASRVPEFFGRKITLRQLANHTSALPRLPLAMYPGAASPQPYAGWGRERTLSALARTWLVRPPGAIYSYSNFGFAVLGLAIENMRGKSYSELVSDLTFRLGCPEVRLWTVDDTARSVVGHNQLGEETKPWDMGAFAAAGGVTSTLGGLTSFALKALSPLNAPALAESMTERSTVKKRAGTLRSRNIAFASALGASLVSWAFSESALAPVLAIGGAGYLGGPIFGLAPTLSWLIASGAQHAPSLLICQRFGFGLIATGIAQSLRKNHDQQEMGIGWHISKGAQGREMLWHNGMTSGFSSFLGLIPGEGRASIVLSS